jgi:hypothetical protein
MDSSFLRERSNPLDARNVAVGHGTRPKKLMYDAARRVRESEAPLSTARSSMNQ